MIEKIKEYLEYRDGGVFWKKAKGSRGKAGDRAGSPDGRGYRHMYFDGKKYREHQLIWILCFGELPEFIDHVDGDPSNNQISNLRAATRSQNMMNAALRKDSKTGSKNVIWDASRNKYRVEIRANNKKHHLGRFDDLELADLIAEEARDLFHGQFTRSAQ